LLVEGTRNISHYQVRNRGTVGGSLALADPAAELPGIAVTCDAEIAIAGGAGERRVMAADFFLGAMATSLAPGEVITGLRLPAWPVGRRWSFMEFSRRRGDFALAGVALFYDLDTEGRATGTHMGVIGASDHPHRLTSAEAIINNSRLDDAAISAAALAASEAVDPNEDIHTPADYRRGLVKTLTGRALHEAASR
jgi:carbon-monoxide dehydrogenase medium subunit